MLLVSFIEEPKRPEKRGRSVKPAKDVSRVAELERELDATRQELQDTIRDLEGANLGILAGSVAVAFLGWAINSYKWQRLLRASGVRRRRP